VPAPEIRSAPLLRVRHDAPETWSTRIFLTGIANHRKVDPFRHLSTGASAGIPYARERWYHKEFVRIVSDSPRALALIPTRLLQVA
jgi:hypothetical protein